VVTSIERETGHSSSLSSPQNTVAKAADPGAPAAGEAEREILRAEEEGRRSVLRGDTAAAERRLADDWISTNNDRVTTRAEYLGRLKSGVIRPPDSIEFDDLRVRIYGELAVVTGRAVTKMEGPDKQLATKTLRFTRVWVKRGGIWQVVAQHWC
jgi:ketosteroid isomerase-like protein